MSPHGVLPPALVWLGRDSRGQETKLFFQLVSRRLIVLAVEYLEADRMQMNRMGIIGGIDEAPDLGRVLHGLFADGVVPIAAIQQQQHGFSGEAIVLVQCEQPRSEERRVGKECRSRWSPY